MFNSLREEFYARRRAKMKRTITEDPLYTTAVRKQIDNLKIKDESKKEVIKQAMDGFCMRLRIRKYSFQFHRNNRIIHFNTALKGYSMVWDYSGRITVLKNEYFRFQVSFTVRDIQDLIVKLEKFGVIEKGELN